MERGCEYSKNRILTIPNVLSFFRIGLIPLIVWQYVHRKNYFVSLHLLALSGILYAVRNRNALCTVREG